MPRNRGKNTTLLSSMTIGGMGPSLAVEGATTARVFETYVEKMLVPSLHAGQIVVMDNLSAHRPRRIRELIEQQGCELLYLPAYSPEHCAMGLNPRPFPHLGGACRASRVFPGLCFEASAVGVGQLLDYRYDYNPIEEALSKIKNLLRKAAARSKGALVEATGAALSAVGPEEVRGYFEHAGYRPAGQLL